MLKSRSVSLAACLAICAAGTLSHGGETQVILHDDFNRADADVVGSEWSSQGTAVLKGNAIEFTLNEEEFRPRIKRTFPLQKDGKFTASFKMDWLRQSEGTWSFHMQLGHSEALPRLLIYNTDLSKGVGVHLVWGGGELVNFQPAGSFGYLHGGKFTPLFVVNDMKNQQSVVKDPVVTIEVDLDSGTYAVTFNGKTYPDLPLENKVPIDTIRFITNGCSKTGFSRSAIDDVKITKGE